MLGCTSIEGCWRPSIYVSDDSDHKIVPPRRGDSAREGRKQVKTGRISLMTRIIDVLGAQALLSFVALVEA